jgi:HlyD family secretion protein
VRIRVEEKESFRPGMSVTAEIETRSRTNALTVPFASVTKRTPKDSSTNAPSNGSKMVVAAATSPSVGSTNNAKADKKKDSAKPIEVVFVKDGDHAKMVSVKIGISDDDYWEITEGLSEGAEVISGSSKAVNRELEDGKKVKKGAATGDAAKDSEKKKE